MPTDAAILVTGASGYVGGRLLTALAAAGRRVRAMARRPAELRARVPAGVEVVGGDVLVGDGLAPALADVTCAYYLVHSMGDGQDFEERERRGAENFAAAARAAGVQRIVYLGGLLDEEHPLSPHLRSRKEVGEILRRSGIETLEFRASIVIGSGSLSFEMVRALVERLPVMITPRWVEVTAQPIAVDDLIAYLMAALTLPAGASQVLEIGGAERVSYGQLMREYARQRGLRRFQLRVPVLTPRLSSLWLGLVTPLYARIGRQLIESIRHPTVVRDPRALELFPLRPRGVRAALASALAAEDAEFGATRWCDAASTARTFGGQRFGNRLVDARACRVLAPPAQVFGVVSRLGGARGWPAWNGLWRVRGWLDLLLGGAGMRRGRAHPERLRVGDVLDCWRVEALEPGRLLRLRAEMRLPGRGWLEFEVRAEAGGARLAQTALFDPAGLLGLAYWYGVWPLHVLVFRGLLAALARAAEQAESQEAQRGA